MITTSEVSFDPLSIETLLLNLSVGAGLGLVLSGHFRRFGTAMASRTELSRGLPFLILIVCLIISVVKSSLALSLGLVGALSIVRFRTPIKEPEELIYLFMAISIGLGLGANQTLLTVAATAFILAVVAIFRWTFFKTEAKNLYVSVHWNNDKPIDPSALSTLIADNSESCDLKRFDSATAEAHAAFYVTFKTADDVFKAVAKIAEQFPGARTTFVDQSRVPVA